MADQWSAGREPHRTLRSSGRRRVWLIVIAVVLLATAIGAATYLLTRGGDDDSVGAFPTGTATGEPSPGASRPRENVVEFSGRGDETTDAFDVAGRWRIDWQAEGTRFQMSIVGDHDFGTVVDQEGPQSGSTVVEIPGNFRLEIVARGAWSAEISQEVEG